MLTVVTANVNGIRAASRRGMGAWLAARRPQVLCLQEVRAPDADLEEALRDWHGVDQHGVRQFGVHQEASAKGRAGVAVLSCHPLSAVRTGLAEPAFAGAGRWVEADLAVATDHGLLTVVSVYVPKGETGTDRQQEKYRFLDAMRTRMLHLAEDGRHVLACGDLNIAHCEADLKNWKGNRDHAGFLPAERSWLDRLLGQDGFVDVHRSLAGEGPGPYTWWSWRGKAFDTDAGWRIDYHLATPGLAALAVKAEVDRAPTYAERWSDHAAVVVDYDLSPSPVPGPGPTRSAERVTSAIAGPTAPRTPDDL